MIPGIAGTFTGNVDAGQPDILVDALVADRQSLLQKDAWQSFIFITILAVLLVWAYKGKDAEAKWGSRMASMAVAVVIIVAIDLFGVGKRYLNSDHFITPKNFEAQYEPRPVDEILFEDTDPDFRVLDLSINTFNSSLASYHHKTIGGYSPVKLQRYQDLIDRYITSEIKQIYEVVGKAETIQDVTDSLPYLKVISMLNGKYIILGDEYPPVENHHAMGHAWLVKDFVSAATPDDEIGLIRETDLSDTAVIGKDFETVQKNFPVLPGTIAVTSDEAEKSADTITLTHYAPNELRYSFSTSAPRAAIFSEVYYPKGWKAWIEPTGIYGKVSNGHYKPTENAQQIDLFRADWILRGAILPEGEGELIMRFEPESYQVGENISRASSITLILLLLAAMAGMFVTGYRKH